MFSNLESRIVRDFDLSCLEEPPQLKKKNTKENIICLPRALQRSVHFPNLSVEAQVKRDSIQKKKKSVVSLHTLISYKLHSVIIYVLHDNLKFKLKNLAAAQFE